MEALVGSRGGGTAGQHLQGVLLCFWPPYEGRLVVRSFETGQNKEKKTRAIHAGHPRQLSPEAAKPKQAQPKQAQKEGHTLL